MAYELLVFDLDGTLIDSALDLALSVNAVREHMDMAPLEHELIYSYVGNGAPMLIRRALGELLPNQAHYFNEGVLYKRFTPAGPDHAQVAASAGMADYFEALAAHHGHSGTAAQTGGSWKPR